MKAEPSCNLQAIRPTSLTARLAALPKNMPKAVHSCHDMTSCIASYQPRNSKLLEYLLLTAPRIGAGVCSAAKIGMVDAFNPMPTPRSNRVTNSCSQVWLTAEPMTEKQQKMADMKMTGLRPSQLFNGSDSQQLKRDVAMYGAELTTPTIHWLRDAFGESAESGMPNSTGKARLAPLDPV